MSPGGKKCFKLRITADKIIKTTNTVPHVQGVEKNMNM